MQLREADRDKAKKADQTEVESIMKATQIHIVVATLITTVTFAAGITLPGGFESNSDSPNQGITILIRKITFRTFVVSDAIAFTFSAVAIFIYFLIADTSRDSQSKKIVKKPYDLACIFQCLPMLVVVIAFATGTYLLEAASKWRGVGVTNGWVGLKLSRSRWAEQIIGLLPNHAQMHLGQDRLNYGDEENEYQVTPTGNTILHVAAYCGHSHFAAEVLKITPALLCHQNKKNETALHIASNEGHIKVVHLLLSIEEHYKEKLMRMTDENGAPALHKAVRSRHKDVASFLKKSLAYLPAGSENDRTTAIHIAVGAGKVDVLHELLNHCPDCWELLDNNGRNALHEDILYSQANVVNFLLKPKWDNLSEDPDNDGNTPLHFLASSNFWGYVPLELKDHPRTMKMPYNKGKKTPFEVAMPCTEWTTDKDRIAPSLFDVHPS
ncbi:hypothetical protein T459_09455 [Capsicum annuum]|uniref:PGG domain-containing protein n=1 Tax=Capsicum annuum TaxID=4072 RepID=A0A2G2ZZE8_CAPAN|nr:hypothetical protein T459_09455 [Capsicum annuum]